MLGDGTFSTRIDALRKNPPAAARRLRALLEPVSDADLAAMASEARAVTRRNFGKTIRLFAPLYLSNECINSCTYCGFSRDNAILRVTLEIEQVCREARHLASEGFRSILLVAGEHPKFVSNGYLERCVRALRDIVPSVAIEVAPMETEEYVPIVAAGAEGVVVYQETYDEGIYNRVHLAGPKKDYRWRLDAPERAYRAGFRRIGVGALLGLADWREDALALAIHLDDLQRRCWKAQYTVSFPRLRPNAGGYEPERPVTDREFIQLLLAFRIAFPAVGIVLSTREPESLRDALAEYGITWMSAGSHTEPGGYTGQGVENIHRTVRGRIVPVEEETCKAATGQFQISDERSPAQVAEILRSRGLEPVWKDWDAALMQ